ncbi:MAG: sigma 54-interacting transcriptional regulator [Desulfobacteraceae bacterium]|jgi:PAS domain S-box-containing protein|nr:sigma 54-interacting transcriptional regulator [Desulfobacteraceae bacterium]
MKNNNPCPKPSDVVLALTRDLDHFNLIFDSIRDGAMVTDQDGIITHFNHPYGKFLGIEPESAIGKHCTEIVENTRMHIVAKTGKPEINRAQKIMGQEMIVQRIPIRKDGRIAAVYGQVVFKDVRDIKRLVTKLSLLESKVKLYEQELINLRSTRYKLDSIIGESPAIDRLKKEALKATSNHFPVLITGESGTGKELFAQAIHHASPRNLHPFIRINCAAIPRELLESELFGYEKGAFTGAKSGGKPGKFELAHRGSFFLDEIGELPIEMQPKLLRVLEEKEFERIGGNTIIRSDFRLIAATNRDLDMMMRNGLFRRDLFYRLNVISIHIPPLRKRREDIVPLSRHLLKEMSREFVVGETEMTPEVEETLRNHHWPGNVRELTNVLERALSTMESDSISLGDLPLYLRHTQTQPTNPPSTLKQAQTAAEKDAIQRALNESGNNKAQAARVLGIHRTLLYKKIKRYGIGGSNENCM